MPDPTDPRIHVTAVNHPVRDTWTDEHAAIAAAEGGLVLGDYLGREVDVYGDDADEVLHCHVYAASDGSAT